MADLNPSLSSAQLANANDLTRLSIKPGNLDYDAYRKYLEMLDHVRSTTSTSITAPIVFAQNAILQSRSSDRTDNKTDFRADQALWSQDNLPDIIYVFDKPRALLEKGLLRDPPLKTYGIYNIRLRDIPILPDHISSKVEGWRVEAWTRFDPRVTLMDIIDRMEPQLRPQSKSVIQMRSLRFREECNLLGWVVQGKNFEEKKAALIKQLKNKGISAKLNSTRGLSWGLITPSLGEAGGRIHVPDHRRMPHTADTTLQPPISASSMAYASGQVLQPARVPVGADNFIFSRENNNRLSQAPTAPTPAAPLVFTSPWNVVYPPLELAAADRYTHADIVTTTAETADPDHATAPVTVIYNREPLILKTPAERMKDAALIAALKTEWHPYGSAARRLQLSYLLDATKLQAGFVDNCGFWKPVGHNSYRNADVRYGVDMKLRYRVY